MTKDELIALGITDEQAEKVLEQHNTEISAEQTKAGDITAELETAKTTITDLTDKVKSFDGVDVEGLKTTVSDWEKKYNEDTAALKLDKALELELITAKPRDAGLIKSVLDLSTLKLEDGKLIGFTEQLEKIKTDKPFLFDADDGNVARVDTGATHTEQSSDTSDAQARAVMGLPESK